MNKHDQAQFLDEYGLTNEYRYNEDHGLFESIDGSDFSEQFVNGAWFVWQDKQKTINDLQAKLNAAKNLLSGINEDLKGFIEADPYDKGYRRAMGCFARDLGKVLEASKDKDA